MHARTAVALVAVLAVFAAIGGYALVSGGSGGTLSTVWTSDTPRNNSVNHHPVGAGEGLVVAPVTARTGSGSLERRSCALVRLERETGAIRWWTGVDPDRCFVHALTQPAVSRLDGSDAGDAGDSGDAGDTTPAVVAGTTENAVVVLDGETGRERFRIPTASYSYGRPTVADVRGDAAPEILAVDIRGGVVVADADGTVRWRANVSGSVWDAPLVADLDGDGEPSVVVGSSDETVAFAPDGSVRWRRPVGGSDVEATRVDNGTMVVATGLDGVYGLDGATGATVWNRSATGSPSMQSLADGDGDGVPEAYVALPGSTVLAVDAATGATDWQRRLDPSSDGVTPPPVLADLTGDGDPELAAATADGTVAVLDPADGAELAAYRRDVPVWTHVTAANLTADPGREVLVRYGDGRVVALAYSE